MINVNETTKNAYRNGGLSNIIRINLPNYSAITPFDIPSECIVFESMQLKEGLSESDSVEFIGCVSSEFKVQLYGYTTRPLKNELIYVYIQSGETEEILLFKGIVQEVDIESNSKYMNISAYDWLYTVGQTDIAQWYNGLTFPISLKDFRDNLFDYLQMNQETTTLPCDNVMIEKQYEPQTLNALYVIKSICQINCRFGILDRDAVFSYRSLPKSSSITVDEHIDFYKSVEYKGYVVRPIDKLTIRQSSDDAGYSYGSGTNNYIIQNNFFTFNLSEEVMTDLVETLYSDVDDIIYYPFASDSNGLPYIEVGDVVEYNVYSPSESMSGLPVYISYQFIVLSRTISGIQNLRDAYVAQGDELQKEFITDLQSMMESVNMQIDTLKEKVKEYSNNYILFSNGSNITIGHNETKTIAETKFACIKPVPVLVLCEYHFSVDTDTSSDSDYDYFNMCELEVIYALGEATGQPTVITSWNPKETYDDGTHKLELMYVLGIEDTRTHTFRISIKSKNGTITIPRFKGYSVVTGQGLVGSTWDGNIVANDNYQLFDFDFMGSFTDSAVVTQTEPKMIETNDNIQTIVFNVVNAFTDSLDANKDMIRAYYGDGLSTYTCGVSNKTWTGSGTVTTIYVKDTTSIEVFGDSGVEYQMSTDMENWYGYVNGDWVLNAFMNKSTIEALTTFLGTNIAIKATLANNAKLSAIQFNGGKKDA